MKLQQASWLLWSGQRKIKYFKKLEQSQLEKLWFQAIEYNDLNVTKAMYATGRIDLALKNEEGWSAVQLAVYRSRKIFAWFLDMHVNMQEVDASGSTIFMLAAQYLDRIIMQRLYATGYFDIHAKNHAGQTALMFAVRGCNSSIVAWLLEHGINIDEKDNKGQTAFMMAIREGYLFIAQQLYATGKVNLDDQDNDGNIALKPNYIYSKTVKLSSWKQTGFMLRKATYMQRESFYARLHYDYEVRDVVGCLQWLLSMGLNVQHKNHEGMTVFMIAARYNCVQILQLLYATGKFDVNDVDKQGNTALMYAVPHNIAIVKMLLSWGADQSCKNDEGYTALDLVNIDLQDVCASRCMGCGILKTKALLQAVVLG